MWQRDGRNINIDEELTLTIRYTEQGSAFKGMRLDHEVMPKLAAAPELLDALKEALDIIRHGDDYQGGPYGFVARTEKLIEKAEDRE